LSLHVVGLDISEAELDAAPQQSYDERIVAEASDLDPDPHLGSVLLMWLQSPTGFRLNPNEVNIVRHEAERMIQNDEEAFRLSDDPAESLKVCLASPVFHPEYSGGASRFRRYAPGLRARGVEMNVIAAEVGAWKSHRRLPQGAGTAGQEPLVEVDRSVVRVPMPARKPRWNNTSIGRNAARLRNTWVLESAILSRCRNAATRPDLLIWRYPPSTTSLRALRTLRHMGIPMMRVVTMFGGPGGRGWRRRLKEVVFPLPFRLLDCVVVSSEVMLENLRSLGVTTRIEVIPHGVDLRRFHPDPQGPSHAPIRRRLRLVPDDEVVLFVGPLSERKGIHILAQAWQRVAQERPRAHLVLVGPIPEVETDTEARPGAPGSRLHAAFGGNAAADRVTIVGPVSDVEEYMRGADLFVLPSRREGMPNVVLEAFASGVPCLLAPFQGLSRDLGRPEREFALAERDPVSWATSMSFFLAEDRVRRRLGAAARRWAIEHLDVEKSLDQLAGLCRELVPGARRIGLGGEP
jgi:glycosyltransferase involved in cell wall biosynthesis